MQQDPEATPAPDPSAGDGPLGDSSIVPSNYLFPFVLVTSLFALWGFANNYTDPLVRAFKEVFLISNQQSSLVQFAFYGGYATMAIPAALVIRKLSFKAGIIIGLALMALGAFITIPASVYVSFNLILVSLYILTFGLAFLETSANPYILSMGPKETATQRLNLAQAFNPVGTLAGGLIASLLILPSMDVARFRTDEMKSRSDEFAEMLPADADKAIGDALVEFRETDPDGHRAMQEHDMQVVRVPYVALAFAAIGVLVLFAVSKLPNTGHTDEPIHVAETLTNLASLRYIGGVLAQAVYVGSQIMCWTFTVHYGMTLLRMEASTAQNWNVAATLVFLVSRFLWTYVLRFVSPGMLLGCLSMAAIGLCLGTVFIEGIVGMICLVGISACMGVMFPTIYGIALDGLSVDDAKLGSAGLIFAIVGGALLPVAAGAVTDYESITIAGMALEGVRVAYLLPVACFSFVALYGFAMAKTASGPEPA
ncbi:MAG: L-fucose:H+ symporter permease [Planctomycetota bacterium]